MPYLEAIHQALLWLHSVYGAVSTFLIVLVIYQAYLLRRSQKTTDAIREQLTSIMEHNVQIQREFIVALTELRIVCERFPCAPSRGSDDKD